MTAPAPTVRVTHPPGRSPERAYAAAVVLGEQLGLAFSLVPESRDDVLLQLAGDRDRSISMPDAFLSSVSDSAWLTPESVPASPPRDASPSPLGAPRVGQDLPVLFGSGDRPIAVAEDGRVTLGVDVLGSAAFLLTRYEEVARPVTDEHGRFPATAALATAGGFRERPLLDEYVELLRAAFEHVWPGLASKAPPLRLSLSHDVDWPLCAPRGRAGARTAAGDIVVRRDPVLALRRLVALGPWARHGSRRLDPCNTFDLMMDLAESAGVRSSFYFMAEGTHPLDGDYRLDDRWVIDLIARIDRRGHEVGLHPSYRTSDEPPLLSEELTRLQRACDAAGAHPAAWGGRQHFLRWRAPTSWRAWADAGLDYDSSVGWADAVGFRSGTCREHPVFDLEAGRRLDLRERPLVVMEATLLDAATPAGLVPGRVADLRAACATVGGDFSLLWHNSRLLERRHVAAFRASVAASAEEIRA